MVWAFFLWRKKRIFKSRAFLSVLVAMMPLGFIATITGWITAEMGRQPWIVYGLMKTRDAVSPIAPGNVAWSLSLFFIFFMIVGSVYLYYLLKILKSGPDFSSPIPPIHIPAGMKPVLNSNQEAV
jgi:cytochrome d ubiquinol oxidase subunit I